MHSNLLRLCIFLFFWSENKQNHDIDEKLTISVTSSSSAHYSKYRLKIGVFTPITQKF